MGPCWRGSQGQVGAAERIGASRTNGRSGEGWGHGGRWGQNGCGYLEGRGRAKECTSGSREATSLPLAPSSNNVLHGGGSEAGTRAVSASTASCPPTLPVPPAHPIRPPSPISRAMGRGEPAQTLQGAA